MHATRVSLIIVAIFFASSFAFSSNPESTVGKADSHPEATPTEYFQASIDHYAAGEFEQSLQAAENDLALLERQVAIAYNNICSAQMRLGALEQAAESCGKSLEFLPGFGRAWNNLTWVYERQAEKTPTAGAYLNLSVAYYWQNDIARSIEASETALELDPGSAIAHNNICAASVQSGNWKRAIRECEIALAIDSDYELAKNNLAWAKTRAIDGFE